MMIKPMLIQQFKGNIHDHVNIDCAWRWVELILRRGEWCTNYTIYISKPLRKTIKDQTTNRLNIYTECPRIVYYKLL